MNLPTLQACAALAALTSTAAAQVETDGAMPAPVVPHVLEPWHAPAPGEPGVGDEDMTPAPFPAEQAARIDALLYCDDEGSSWVRGRTYKAGAETTGFTYVPYLGAEASRIYPVRFTLAGATDGGAPIPLNDGASVSRDGHRFTLDRGPVDVLYDAALDSVEQLFVIERPLRQGAIALSIAVETDLEIRPDGRGFRFDGPEGGVTYSGAVAFDAAGARTDVPATLEEGRIVLTVPAEFVRSSTGAITVDPVTATFPVNLGTDRSFFRPDVAYDRSNDEFMYAYEEQFAVGDRDILATRTSSTGTFLGNEGIGVGIRDVADPAIANVNGANTCLIVFAREPVGGGDRDIIGRLFDMDTGVLANSIVISTDQDNFKPDVGGSFSTAANGVFLVGWSKEFGDGDQKARFRSLSPAGTLGTLYAFNLVEDVLQSEVVIGKSTGDPGTVNFWPVAVRVEDRITGEVRVTGQRWRTDGDGVFEVAQLIRAFPNADAFDLDISSGLETRLGGSASLSATYLIAYTLDAPGQEDATFIIVCRESEEQGIPYLLQLSEHASDDLFYRLPKLGVTRNGYLVSYLEDQPGLNLNHEVYLSYLQIVEEDAIGIGEQRTFIGDTGALFAGGAAIATRYDGGFTDSRRSAVAWSRFETITGNSTWNMQGAAHFANLNNGVFGAQYCFGTENSTGERGFITIVGGNDVTSDKTVRCYRLPPFQFSLLAIGTLPAQINPVPNSQGTLCIAGDIGRFNGQINQASASGEVSFTVDPTMLPTPNAIVPAMAGQVRVFQAWHRDTDMGMQTSNFTNAVVVRFR